jgi:hypothetical protein
MWSVNAVLVITEISSPIFKTCFSHEQLDIHAVCSPMMLNNTGERVKTFGLPGTE